MQHLFFRFRLYGGNLGLNDLLNRALNAVQKKGIFLLKTSKGHNILLNQIYHIVIVLRKRLPMLKDNKIRVSLVVICACF
jgi:hypothetical protein